MINLADYQLKTRDLWRGAGLWDRPLAVIDLDLAEEIPADWVLPLCPVIGIGSAEHLLAQHLDAVVEAPIELGSIIKNVLAKPLAAASFVQLLRVLSSLNAQNGLIAESMAYALLQGSAEHRDWLEQSRKSVEVQLSEGRVVLDRRASELIITLDNPACGNAIDRAMRDGLHSAFTMAAIDPSIERIVLCGAGRTFSLGAELSEFGTTTDPATAHHIRSLTLPAHMAAQIAGRLEVHVQGGCVGSGLELAAWGAKITATPDAWFHLPELAMGIVPGAGGCVSLTRRMGRQRTALLALSGKRISAKTALGWGLIDAIAANESGAD